MSVWPRYPTLYEINIWVWLSDLDRRYGKALDLSSVPLAEGCHWLRLGVCCLES
jgi:hypothetical protein